MPRLIINADDYGFDRNRTEAIRECFRNGLLTQTTLMVNMPYCEQAVAEAKKDGFIDRVGLHLNLTFGRPLTKAISCQRRFCDTNGNFTGLFHRKVISRFLITREERLAVVAEIIAQMESYVSLGLSLMHIDSHHHSHTDPIILRSVLPLAKEFGFKSVRISRNLPKFKGVLKHIYKKYVNGAIQKSFAYADYFGPADAFVSSGECIPQDRVVELMVHPLYSHDRDMELNREYNETEGVLCDSRSPMEMLSRSLAKICNGGWKKCSYREIQ